MLPSATIMKPNENRIWLNITRPTAEFPRESYRPFLSQLCDQSQSFFFGVVAYCAGRVKVHGCPLFRSVCGPMRQAVVIGIAGSGKIHPSSTDLLRQNECRGIAPTIVVANFGIVECECDFTGVEGTGAIVQHGRPPGIYVRVCWRSAQSSL